MKLNHALESVKPCKDLHWIAVDKNKELWAFTKKPKRKAGVWVAQDPDCKYPKYDDLQYLGMYTGKKDWKNTLRKIK